MNWLKKRPYIFFILPGFLIYTILVVYPIFSAFSVSLTKWNGIGGKTFVGFGNYVQLFTSQELYTQFYNALGNNLTLFLLGSVVTLPLQIYMAYMIYNKVFGHNYCQVMTFSTQFISSPIILLMSTLLLDSNVGLVNKLIEITIGPEYVRQWAGLPEYGIYIVWVMMTFSGIGIGMLFLIGAMKMVPVDIIEASRIDGAGYWGVLFRVILPQIRVTVLNLLIVTYITMMTAFDYNYVMGGANGSGGIRNVYDSLSLFFYRVSFGNIGQMGGTLSTNAMGMGTAIACIMFMMTFIVSMFQVIFVYGRRGE